MLISIEKTELYIISELVDGPNLEELIFETDDQPNFTITPERKKSIGKNRVPAVAYLPQFMTLALFVFNIKTHDMKHLMILMPF